MKRPAFTLLETLVAATIAVVTLGAAVTVNGVVSRSQVDTVAITQAELLAQQTLAQVATSISLHPTATISDAVVGGPFDATLRTTVPLQSAAVSSGVLWCRAISAGCASPATLVPVSAALAATSITAAERITLSSNAPYSLPLQTAAVSCTSTTDTQYRRLVQMALVSPTMIRIVVTVQPTCNKDGVETLYATPVVRSTQVTRSLWQ
jgi:type II secretory pathway pseudopilin PulG